MFHHWLFQEIASVLLAFSRHGEWERGEVLERPPSGSMLLYNRNRVRYRRDGYCWKKRKDGKTIREDHMKLKVQGMEVCGECIHMTTYSPRPQNVLFLDSRPSIRLISYNAKMSYLNLLLQQIRMQDCCQKLWCESINKTGWALRLLHVFIHRIRAI